MEDYLKEFYQELNNISKEITFDNVINDDGDPVPLNPQSYKGKVYLELKDKLEVSDSQSIIERLVSGRARVANANRGDLFCLEFCIRNC